MPSGLSVFPAFVLALVFAVPAVTSAQTPSALSGTVITTGGTPVANASVVLTSAGRADVIVRTDQDGRFTIANVPAGRHRVLTSFVGMSPADTFVTVEASAATPQALTIVLVDIVRERVNVVGDVAALTRAPGSTHLIDGAELKRIQLALTMCTRCCARCRGSTFRKKTVSASDRTSACAVRARIAAPKSR